MRKHIHTYSQRLVSFVMTTFLLCCGMSVYAQNQSVADAISACATEKNSLKRLVCYDRIHTDLTNYQDVTISPVAVPQAKVPQATVPQLPASNMKAPQEMTPKASVPKPSASSVSPSTPISTDTPVTPHSVVSPVTAPSVDNATETFGKEVVTSDTMQSVIMDIKTDRNNYKTITLTNGQVWKQVRSEDRARLSVGQSVTFEKGVFGAIYMSAENSNRQLAVKRIK